MVLNKTSPETIQTIFHSKVLKFTPHRLLNLFLILVLVVTFSSAGSSVSAHSNTCGSAADVMLKLYDNNDLTGLIHTWCVDLNTDRTKGRLLGDVDPTANNDANSMSITVIREVCNNYDYEVTLYDGNNFNGTVLSNYTGLYGGIDYHFNFVAEDDNRLSSIWMKTC